MKLKYSYVLIGIIAVLLLNSCRKNEYETGGVVSPVLGLSYVKDLHNGDDVILTKEVLKGASQISGVIISDVDNGNFEANQIILQNTWKDKTSGIVLKFDTESHDFKKGDSIKVEVTKGTLTRKNGTLCITGLNYSDITKVSSNNEAMVTELTLAQLNAEFQNYESTLVKIHRITFVDAAEKETFKGEKILDDDTGVNLKLKTSSSASFADDLLPVNLSLTVIPSFYHPTKDSYPVAEKYLRMRDKYDMSNISGVEYENFPENFELAVASSKNDYDMPAINNTVTFQTGNWKIYQGIIGNVVNADRFNPLGLQSIRLQSDLSESAYLEMGFDLPDGASKVTFIYGSYANDQPSTFSLEYSQDHGTTWKTIGATVSNAKAAPQIATFIVDIKGNVRFRINKHGLGVTDFPKILNGKLSIDDFTVYKNI